MLRSTRGSTALELLQKQVSRSGEMHAWLDNHQLDGFGRLWQGIRIEPGWEDALEAVLRERLNGIALDDLQTRRRLARPAPARQGLVLPEAQRRMRPSEPAGGARRCSSYITCTDPGVAAVLTDWLEQRLRRRTTLRQGFAAARRACLPVRCWSARRATCSRATA